jgi:hypothetical protein
MNRDRNQRPLSLKRSKDHTPSVSEVFEFVTDYAKQETIGPLRGAGRWLGFGVLAAIMLGTGIALMLLGLLRLLQTEWTRSASGSLSWLAYLIVLVVGALVLAFTLSRIRKTTLNPKETS